MASTGTCPRELGPTSTFVRLEPAATIEGERAQVGFGHSFSLRAQPHCDVVVRWIARGRAQVSDDGLTISSTSPTMQEVGLDPATFDLPIVPISPRTRGTLVLRLRVGGEEYEVPVHAALRASGVPSVAVGARMHLVGGPWSVVERPLGSSASVDASVGTFSADRPGTFVLARDDGARMAILAGTHASTDLDCGRPECHESTVQRAESSPMVQAWHRIATRSDVDPSCAVACHAVGEMAFGADEGFEALAARVGWPLPRTATAIEQMPRELRRLAGVGCTACHGPGSIPARNGRHSILSSHVCAVCHDAPPRYTRVVEWMSTAMARRDGDSARTREPCARCHTTQGWLGLGEGGPAEITCVACHAPHAESTGPHLLRRQPLPAGRAFRRSYVDGPSQACIGCHARDDEVAPGHLGVATRLAEIRADPGHPHAELAAGCLACHGARNGARTSHDFAVMPETCARCHDAAVASRCGEPSDRSAWARCAHGG